ncbi:hypothetical protein JTB14_003700 [Gonioctena quinquepunctata]|nr:hypothetical protein JTB14_003700 [Gonioctena quinquepunctata]
MSKNAIESFEVLKKSITNAMVRLPNGNETADSTRHLAPRGDTNLMEESVLNIHGDLQENINSVEDKDSTGRSENKQQTAENYSGKKKISSPFRTE